MSAELLHSIAADSVNGLCVGKGCAKQAEQPHGIFTRQPKAQIAVARAKHDEQLLAGGFGQINARGVEFVSGKRQLAAPTRVTRSASPWASSSQIRSISRIPNCGNAL